jgi:hypothetical protein
MAISCFQRHAVGIILVSTIDLGVTIAGGQGLDNVVEFRGEKMVTLKLGNYIWGEICHLGNLALPIVH